jgi:hypothetical protein
MPQSTRLKLCLSAAPAQRAKLPTRQFDSMVRVEVLGYLAIYVTNGYFSIDIG